MRKQREIYGDRPPSFVAKSTLAAELDVSEATVDNWVERGILPQPIRCGTTPRWSWAEVQAAMSQKAQAETDPFMAGVNNVR
ncbi:MAG: transcriptional regulator [Rhodobacteraceae bacterium GWE1_64_9]|nr:MAG: transcriptional regulator [Rhodobacteraceae bacterium GWE1_64_9]OHC48182.1 MAG: transcriptional regulator [Rhodobacteraceae bacterium GWF1_65_7]HBD91114.1 transcriptional regulator [Gemmobacter sp.]